MKRTHAFATILTLALLIASTAFAQSWAGRGRLQGQVLDDNGDPIEGAEVVLMKDGVEGQGPEPIVTNKKGKWSILGLGGGSWTAVISADGYRPGEGTVSVSEFGSNPSINVPLRKITEEELQEASNSMAKGRIDEGNQLLESGKFAEARAAYEEALADIDEVNKAPLLRGIARTYFEEGNQDQAIATLEQALTIDAEDIDSLRLIINLLVAADREADAQTYMARLPEGSTVDSNTLLNIGIKAYNDGNLETAIETFDRVVAENQELADAYYYRGLSHLNQGSNSAAKADFVKLLALDPDHANAGEAKEFISYLESLE